MFSDNFTTKILVLERVYVASSKYSFQKLFLIEKTCQETVLCTDNRTGEQVCIQSSSCHLYTFLPRFVTKIISYLTLTLNHNNLASQNES